MTDDNAYNRNVNKRMQEELAEFNTPSARLSASPGSALASAARLRRTR